MLYNQEEGLEELEYDNDDEGAQVRLRELLRCLLLSLILAATWSRATAQWLVAHRSLRCGVAGMTILRQFDALNCRMQMAATFHEMGPLQSGSLEAENRFSPPAVTNCVQMAATFHEMGPLEAQGSWVRFW